MSHRVHLYSQVLTLEHRMVLHRAHLCITASYQHIQHFASHLYAAGLHAWWVGKVSADLLGAAYESLPTLQHNSVPG